jgi:hypothetical protein
MNLKSLLRCLIRETLDANVEQQVEEIVDEPEYQSTESLAEFKLENDETAFSTAEAHAIARNMMKSSLGKYKNKISASDPQKVKLVIKELESYGFLYRPLQPIKQVRGITSNPHGKNPFAGMGGGGSGFGSDFGGSTFTSFGGGPGAMGSGTKWDSSAKTSLPMGSRRR